MKRKMIVVSMEPNLHKFMKRLHKHHGHVIVAESFDDVNKDDIKDAHVVCDRGVRLQTISEAAFVTEVCYTADAPVVEKGHYELEELEKYAYTCGTFVVTSL